MSAGSRRSHPGFVELYQLSLERQLQQGKWDPVCRDEDLCKVVKGSLSKSGAQEVHSQLGPDTLSVIETSLRTSSGRSGPSRLGHLAKAFQVLELAALNLYLCPWRKEYRVVKMFSGMFTHCIKPALTSQQAQELFGLLGYQAGGAEEELRLRSKPTSDLLHLACAFFVARLECQLLLSVSSDSAGDGSEWELQLVHERRRGLSLHAARDKVRKKMEAAPPSGLSNVDTVMDLYTDPSASEGHRMSSPPSSSYVPPGMPEWDGEGRSQEVCVSTATCRMAPKNNTKAERLIGRESGSHAHRGMQCGDTSASLWSCEEQGRGPPEVREQQKDVLKQHGCMIELTEDFFVICHDCLYIHDVACTDAAMCHTQRHNVQLTGKLQPPQVPAPPQRHSCLETDHTPLLVCNTCNMFHDLLCPQKEVCQTSDHDLEYLNTTAHRSDMPPTTDFHRCCVSTLPEFGCSTCGLFHTFSCNDNRCQQQHEVKRLTSACSACPGTSDLFIICKYCWAQYCKSCWFKTPLNCGCGKPFPLTSSV